MDLSSGFDYPNPYGLRAADFDYDMVGYEVALRFLSDLAGGSPEPRALELNGGSPAQLRAWESNGRFRRVLARCRQANAQEMAAAARKAAEAETEESKPDGRRFIPLEEAPVVRGLFSHAARPDSWGG